MSVLFPDRFWRLIRFSRAKVAEASIVVIIRWHCSGASWQSPGLPRTSSGIRDASQNVPPFNLNVCEKINFNFVFFCYPEET